MSTQTANPIAADLRATAAQNLEAANLAGLHGVNAIARVLEGHGRLMLAMADLLEANRRESVTARPDSEASRED